MQVSTDNTPYRPSVDHRQKMARLNDEFNRTAQIQGLASYIYYPTQRKHPCFGHGELEVEGISWTLMIDRNYRDKSLSRMIQSSTSGRGFPFFRFNIAVTPNQLSELRENVWKTRSICCSHGALWSLSRNGKYSVPLPFTIAPVTSGAYLVAAKLLGSDRIKKIQFVGGESKLVNLAKSTPGVLVEVVGIGMLFAAVSVMCLLRLCKIDGDQ